MPIIILCLAGSMIVHRIGYTMTRDDISTYGHPRFPAPVIRYAGAALTTITATLLVVQ